MNSTVTVKYQTTIPKPVPPRRSPRRGLCFFDVQSL